MIDTGFYHHISEAKNKIPWIAKPF